MRTISGRLRLLDKLSVPRKHTAGQPLCSSRRPFLLPLLPRRQLRVFQPHLIQAADSGAVGHSEQWFSGHTDPSLEPLQRGAALCLASVLCG